MMYERTRAAGQSYPALLRESIKTPGAKQDPMADP